jgi:hypothetical protein
VYVLYATFALEFFLPLLLLKLFHLLLCSINACIFQNSDRLYVIGFNKPSSPTYPSMIVVGPFSPLVYIPEYEYQAAPGEPEVDVTLTPETVPAMPVQS